MKKNLSAGQISRVLIILAIILFFSIIVVYVVIKLAALKKTQIQKPTTSITNNEPPPPVYETTIQNVRFIFESSVDMGSVLRGSAVKSAGYFQKDLTSTERFIQVTVGAQNKGKINIQQYDWDLGNVIDSDGRNFVPDNQAYFWLPVPNLCGALLKPEFTPIPCVKIYEVSKESKGLKIEVKINEPKKQTTLLDLKFTY